MNHDQISGQWNQAIGKIKESWGKITDQDLEKVRGKKDQLIGLIQEKYGDTREKIEEKVNAIFK